MQLLASSCSFFALASLVSHTLDYAPPVFWRFSAGVLHNSLRLKCLATPGSARRFGDSWRCLHLLLTVTRVLPARSTFSSLRRPHPLVSLCARKSLGPGDTCAVAVVVTAATTTTVPAAVTLALAVIRTSHTGGRWRSAGLSSSSCHRSRRYGTPFATSNILCRRS